MLGNTIMSPRRAGMTGEKSDLPSDEELQKFKRKKIREAYKYLRNNYGRINRDNNNEFREA